MIRKILLILLVPMLLEVGGVASPADAQVLCRREGRAKSKLKIRQDVCKRNERQVDLTELQAPETDASRWSWLGEGQGTYWYVPERYLPAVRWDTDDPSSYAFLSDQTVWHIQNYQSGYFFGPVVVKFEGVPRLCQFMIGSVTPNGNVYIAFNSVQTVPVGTPSITVGTGQMTKRNSEWMFNMQMASGSAQTQVAHWAFMRQCTPDQNCWSELPGVELSIPEFLELCDTE